LVVLGSELLSIGSTLCIVGSVKDIFMNSDIPGLSKIENSIAQPMTLGRESENRRARYGIGANRNWRVVTVTLWGGHTESSE
jgi:hypothetical protein